MSQFYVHSQTDLDLTYEEDQGNWFCETHMDPDPRPAFDEVTCSRIVPDETEWETREVQY